MLTRKIVILTALVLAAACEGAQLLPTAPTPPAAPPETPPAAPPETHTVRVLDNRFDPQILRIAPGDYVRWELFGAGPHNIDDGNGHETFAHFFPSGIWHWSYPYLDSPGDSYLLRFPESEDGKPFYYYCSEHSAEMNGWILVGKNAQTGWDL